VCALLLGSLFAPVQAGCGSEPEFSSQPSEPASEPSGALQGELSSVSVLSSDGRRSMLYSLKVAGADVPTPLDFEADPNLPSGSRLRVWGDQREGALHVTRHELMREGGDAEDSAASRVSALIGQPAATRRVAWVQMDVNGGGVSQSKADAQRIIFDTNPGPLFGTRQGDKSVVQYYDENSYGTLKLTGQVEGPIPFNGTACNNFDPLARDVVAKVTALGRTYDHYYLYWGSKQDCGPGWGQQGTRARPGKHVWLNQDGTFCTATGQEIGHNFGLMHASTMDCGSATLANTTSSCTSNEYGNPLTVMGGGCRHLISIEKWYSGFFRGCNAVKLKASGTFTLLPIEVPCGGIQALQIPMPSNAPTRTTSTSQSNGNVTVKFYYLELRGGHGIDTNVKKGVYVHVAPDVPAPTSNGPRTFLLDMNPSTNSFDPMSVGQTFTDPAGGVSFTLDAVDDNHASVRVTIEGGTGANTCVDNTTLTGSGPATCGDGGATGTGGSGGMAGSGGIAGNANGGSVNGGSAGRGGGGSGGGAGRGGAGGSPTTGGASSSGGAAGNSGALGMGGSGNGGSSGAGGANGGSSNTGGSSGNGGTTASGGASSAGGPAIAGAAGMLGTAGMVGAGGAGGVAGSPGTPATGGTLTTGGTSNTGGVMSGGLPSSGGVGTAGGGPIGNPNAGSAGVPAAESGCTCDLGRSSSHRGSPLTSTFALLATAMSVLRRRRGRAQ
jgi:hypothetical protein